MIAKVFRNQSEQDLTSFIETSSIANDDHRSTISIKSLEDVNFFDSFYEDLNDFVIVNVDRHVFYRNVYVFFDRLKDLVKSVFEKQKIRKLIFDYLRENSLI